MCKELQLGDLYSITYTQYRCKKVVVWPLHAALAKDNMFGKKRTLKPCTDDSTVQYQLSPRFMRSLLIH